MRQWSNIAAPDPVTLNKFTPSRSPRRPGLSSTYAYTSAAARLASKGDLSGFYLTTATNVLFRIYQYWEHQNNGKRLEGEIHEDGKWQACVFAPNAMTYLFARSGKDLSQHLRWSLTAYEVGSEIPSG